jgi:hypothetical protein
VHVVELLSKRHDREGFDCGSEPLNLILRQTARQHADRGISRRFVLTDEEGDQKTSKSPSTPKNAPGSTASSQKQSPSHHLLPIFAAPNAKFGLNGERILGGLYR